MELEIDIIESLLRGGSAIVSGICMGLERQIKGKAAGLKTNILVALGATTFIIISNLYAQHENTDLTRVLGQIIVGVGFLGAGVILKQKSSEKIWGLATAATIWCSAAAGCLAGLGIYDTLLAFTLMVVFVNLLFGYFGKKVNDISKNGD
ncbi:MgtC/SapB family protein [Mesonia aquimarina]|uniref:MgtC/SapB family protein n=1 Tax=Mesonia aquimarina TaxID=1504967 RepID=UPI000EF58A57|nr:MgtC/SapB family protein [Mesonia aquimarina]